MDQPLALRAQVPEGVKDRLAQEARLAKQLGLTLTEVYRRWGYQEVMTPAFEFLEAVGPVTGRRSGEELYQFFDRRGRTLALRPDMTTPVARLVATKLTGSPLPLRVAYCANVFRYPDRRVGLHEEWQAGVELVGAGGTAADAEVIALACEAMATAGLSGFKVGLGHVDVVEGLFAEAGLPEPVAEELKSALVNRDFVAYETAVGRAGLTAPVAGLLLSLCHFAGSWEQAAGQFRGVSNPRVGAALERLGETLNLLGAYGVRNQVSLDLGLARSFDYYTGVVFEAYAPGVGAPVCGGGRYDRLLSQFGLNQPATGFALDLDRVLAALERQGRLPAEPDPGYLLPCLPGREAEAFARARELRSHGHAVEIDLSGRPAAQLSQVARQRGVQLLSLDGAPSASGTASAHGAQGAPGAGLGPAGQGGQGGQGSQGARPARRAGGAGTSSIH